MSEGKAAERGTPVARLYVRLVGLSHPVYGLSDEERGVRCDTIAAAVDRLAHLPAETLTDAGHKLAVLCTRLRGENHSPAAPSGALTVRLAESARDDLTRLAILAAGPVDAPGS